MKLKKVDVALIAMVLVIIVAGAAYYLSISGSAGDTVTTTVKLDFGSSSVPAPFNQGNDTEWTKVGETWTATTSPNATGVTTWTFRDLTSGSNCYEQLLAAASIGEFHIDSESQALGIIVTGMANNTNLQHENRAWQYYVDGVYANKACNYYAIQDGDTVIWRYITNQAN
jgi:hypothetical protein